MPSRRSTKNSLASAPPPTPHSLAATPPLLSSSEATEDPIAYFNSFKTPNLPRLLPFHNKKKRNLFRQLDNYFFLYGLSGSLPVVQLKWFDYLGAIQVSKQVDKLDATPTEAELKLVDLSACRIVDKDGYDLVLKAGDGLLQILGPGDLHYRLLNALMDFLSSTLTKKDELRHELNEVNAEFTHPAVSPTMIAVQEAARSINNRILGPEHPLSLGRPPTLPSYHAPPPKAGLVRHMHAAFVPLTGTKIHDIQLHAGPQDGLFHTATAREATEELLEQLKPISQIQDQLIQSHMPALHSRLRNITSKLPPTCRAMQNKLGLLTSRSFIVNCRTKRHIDSKDDVHGMCCILPLGSFVGANVCFPSLGLKILVPPGTFVFFRSYLLPHYITAFSGHRFCVVSFMHQVVVDYYNQETGTNVDDPTSMPEWWRRPRANQD